MVTTIIISYYHYQYPPIVLPIGSLFATISSQSPRGKPRQRQRLAARVHLGRFRCLSLLQLLLLCLGLKL